MTTKLSRLRELTAAGDWHAAIRLAASFPELGEAKVAVSRAASAMTAPGIYEQMGESPKQLVEEGVRAICERYGWPCPERLLK